MIGEMSAWDALRFVLLAVGWPGLLLTSGYAVWRAVAFYRGVRRTPPGLLVMLTVIGWVATLVGVAVVSTFYLIQDPENAGPVVLPVFVLWAGSMLVITWTVTRWGKEAVTLDTYYLELERMDQVKSQFINNVAHELNTPITPIRMRLGMLRDGTLGELNERQIKSLQVIDRNVDRLALLVDQVILASFIQSGRLKLERIAIPLEGPVQRAATAVAEDAARKGKAPSVRVDVGDAVGAVDADRFQFAVAAVLGYLVAKTPASESVHVSADSAGEAVRIAIASPHEIPEARSAFEPFGAPMETDRLKDMGLGMELFIARGIIEAHGGRVQLRIGEGTRFVFEVPTGASGEQAASADRPTVPARP